MFDMNAALLTCPCRFCWLKEGTLIVLPAEGGVVRAKIDKGTEAGFSIAPLR